MDGDYRAGAGTEVDAWATVGFVYRDGCAPAVLGRDCRIRRGAIIYCDVTVGDGFQSGHNVLIRECTHIGDQVVIGTNTVIDGDVTIAAFVKIESNCYVPTHTRIGTRAFLGPGVVLTNDKYPLKMRDDYTPQGPIIEDGVTLGGGVVVLPGVRIGSDSFVAAASVVTHDVPPRSLVIGSPGRVFPLPDELKERNIALSWRRFLDEHGNLRSFVTAKTDA